MSIVPSNLPFCDVPAGQNVMCSPYVHITAFVTGLLLIGGGVLLLTQVTGVGVLTAGSILAFVGGAICIVSVVLFCVQSTKAHSLTLNHDREDIELGSHVAQSDSTPETQNSDRIRAPFNRLPCQHEGNSCFVNTALQVITHIAPLRHLMDKNLNNLSKGSQESAPTLKKRKIVQEKGNQLINCILAGERADTLEDFVTAVNDALSVIAGAYAEKYILDNGGYPPSFLDDILSILIPDERNWHPPLPDTYLHRTDEIREEYVEYHPEMCPPQLLYFVKHGPHIYASEIQIDGFGTYHISTLMHFAHGHSIPIIRTEDGRFFKLDDLADRAQEMNEADVKTIFEQGKWDAVYYTLQV